MKVKPQKSEREIDQITLGMLIDFYAGDMQRRGLTVDSVTSNVRVLARFSHFLATDDEAIKLKTIIPERAKDYVTSLQN